MQAICSLGLSYEMDEKPKEAKTFFFEGLWLELENVDVLYALAFLYLKQEQKTEAIEIANKIIGLPI